MTEHRPGFWHKALTVTVTVMTLVTGYMATAVRSVVQAQHQTEVTLAVMAESINTHNVNANGWIETIRDNQTRIVALETGHAIATKDRFTKTEALDAIESLKKWVEKNYKHK